MKRDVGIDCIKVLACICVVGLHTIGTDNDAINYFFTFLCGCAIPLFMMSSGFFLFSNKEKLTQIYVTQKIIHILRFCLIWAMILTCVSFVQETISNGITLSAFKKFAQVPNEVLLNFLQCGNVPVLWYCGSLILLYAFAYLYKIKNLNPYTVWLCSFGIGILFQIASYILNRPVQQAFTQTFRMWTWIQYAILGGILMPSILTFFKKRIPLLVHFLLVLVMVPALSLYQVYMSKYVLHTHFPEFFYDSISMILIAILMFSFIHRCFSKQCENNFIFLLSKLSLGVFTIHFPIYSLALKFIPQHTGSFYFLRFFVITVISFMVSYLISKTKLSNYLLKI